MSKVLPPPALIDRIAFLDYLRIFAFTSVLIGHKFYGYGNAITSNESIHYILRLIVRLILPLFHGGGAGVVIFFIISGYIITSVLQTENSFDFLIKRIFRIYPLYITAVLLQATVIFVMTGATPDPLVMIAQLLLIGDIFGTPYTLDGVEWTLRLEVLFYTFMVILRQLNILHKYNTTLPGILITTILILGGLAPIPSYEIWSKGYLTIYSPFLLLGCMFCLKDLKQINYPFLLTSITIILIQYHYLIMTYQPRWTESHFAILSTLIFFISWRYNYLFKSNRFIFYFSELTYSVYLFHNWAWNPIKHAFKKISLEVFHPDIQALFALILGCFLMVRLVEKPSIRIGKSIAADINRFYSNRKR